MNKTYPSDYFLFPDKVNSIPEFSACNSDNERKTLTATNARDRKTRADIVTMNATLSNVFLANLPKAIRETYEPICMKQPNTVFLHMFDWFIKKYGKTTTKDCEENRQRMAADWHPSDGFEPLATCLFIGASNKSATRYPMEIHDVIDIGLCIIKVAECTPKNPKNGLPARTSPHQLEKQSTPSKNIRPTRSHLSTRQLPQPRNMDMAWLPWTMIRQLHPTVNRLRTLAPHMPPHKNQ